VTAELNIHLKTLFPPKKSPTRGPQIPHPRYSCNCVFSGYWKQG